MLKQGVAHKITGALPPQQRLMQAGGVLAEFLISLPILIAFLVGMLSSGRLLNSIATTGQAAFLGGLLASQANNPSDLDAIPSRVHKILCMQNRKLENLNCTPFGTPPASPPANLVTVTRPTTTGLYDDKIIKIAVHGDFKFIMRSIDLDLDVTAPLLLLQQTLPNLSTPSNPSPAYGCIGGANNAACDCCKAGADPRGDYCLNPC